MATHPEKRNVTRDGKTFKQTFHVGAESAPPTPVPEVPSAGAPVDAESSPAPDTVSAAYEQGMARIREAEAQGAGGQSASGEGKPWLRVQMTPEGYRRRAEELLAEANVEFDSQKRRDLVQEAGVYASLAALPGSPSFDRYRRNLMDFEER